MVYIPALSVSWCTHHRPRSHSFFIPCPPPSPSCPFAVPSVRRLARSFIHSSTPCPSTQPAASVSSGPSLLRSGPFASQASRWVPPAPGTVMMTMTQGPGKPPKGPKWPKSVEKGRSGRTARDRRRPRSTTAPKQIPGWRPGMLRHPRLVEPAALWGPRANYGTACSPDMTPEKAPASQALGACNDSQSRAVPLARRGLEFGNGTTGAVRVAAPPGHPRPPRNSLFALPCRADTCKAKEMTWCPWSFFAFFFHPAYIKPFFSGCRLSSIGRARRRICRHD